MSTMTHQHKRSPHPGVVLAKRVSARTGAVGWRARYRDPDTGLIIWETLEASLSTKEARRAWARKKSEALSHRRAELASGAPLKTETPIDDAIEQYFESCGNRLRDHTINSYRQGVRIFQTWAKKRGIRLTEELTAPRLAGFREALIAERKKRPIAGGKRGRRESSRGRRSPVTINTYLRCIKTLINHWRALGKTPKLHRDEIFDSLKNLPVPRNEPNFLRPPALLRLLEAAVEHDADLYAETREEHSGLRARGTTLRNIEIAPFTALLVLTGMRRGEALALKWEHVELDARDEQGKSVGEIHLPATVTKTHRARTVWLEVAPSLRTLLGALKPKTNMPLGYVFGDHKPYTADLVETARTRLIERHGAPPFTWQALRATCATYLTNAPGIWRAATVYMSARQLGHSVDVAERHYLGVYRGIPPGARTLEAAMRIEAELRTVIDGARQPAKGLKLLRA